MLKADRMARLAREASRLRGGGDGQRAVRERGEGTARPLWERLAPPELSRALELQRQLDPALIEAPVPRAMSCFRVVDSLESTFGVSDPEAVEPGPHRIPGYLATVHGRFLDPPDREDEIAALIHFQVPCGAPALWLAGDGDPSTLPGADLLLLDNPTVRFIGHRQVGRATVVIAEVLATR